MILKSVTLSVKKEYLEEFKKATLVNQQNSIKETGVHQFDVFQSEEDPTKFMLHEVYKYEEAVEEHLQTKHFKKWFETVNTWFDGPRERSVYNNVSEL